MLTVHTFTAQRDSLVIIALLVSLLATAMPYKHAQAAGANGIDLAAPGGSAQGIIGLQAPPGRQWIEVDLSDQMLVAWQGEAAVLPHRRDATTSLVRAGQRLWHALAR